MLIPVGLRGYGTDGLSTAGVRLGCVRGGLYAVGVDSPSFCHCSGCYLLRDWSVSADADTGCRGGRGGGRGDCSVRMAAAAGEPETADRRCYWQPGGDLRGLPVLAGDPE